MVFSHQKMFYYSYAQVRKFLCLILNSPKTKLPAYVLLLALLALACFSGVLNVLITVITQMACLTKCSKVFTPEVVFIALVSWLPISVGHSQVGHGQGHLAARVSSDSEYCADRERNKETFANF